MERHEPPTLLEREVAVISMAKKHGIEPVPNSANELLGMLPGVGYHINTLDRPLPLPATEIEVLAGSIIFALDQMPHLPGLTDKPNNFK